MPIEPSLPILILAAGTEIWSFSTWKKRTKCVTPPFSDDATPEDTKLQPWELAYIEKMALNVDKYKTFDHRLSYILSKYDTNRKLKHALDNWVAWVQPNLGPWGIQKDIEQIFIEYSRHPSQIRAVPSSTDLVSPAF